MGKVDWNSYAKKGMLRAVIDPKDKSGVKNILIDRIHWDTLYKSIRGSKHLLDFGCGTARFAQRIISLGVNYTGIDSSPGMIEEAKHYNPQAELKFVLFDGVNLPFPESSFDVCLSTGVLQYILNGPDTKKIIFELQRILAPQGRFILIEQVSLSNRTSGTVELVSTESDYLREMSDFFSIKRIERIRSCNFSRLTNGILYLAAYFRGFYKHIVGPLATFEIWRTRNASDQYFTGIDYYDVYIESVKNGERN
jgi:ubiquinone/menaquinone biosynthesis C-methylase UbiE